MLGSQRGSSIGGMRKQLHLGCKWPHLASFCLSSFILHAVQEAEKSLVGGRGNSLVAGPLLLPHLPSILILPLGLSVFTPVLAPQPFSPLPQLFHDLGDRHQYPPGDCCDVSCMASCLWSPGLTSPLATVGMPWVHHTSGGPMQIL